jgi:hypothetical protein
MNFGSLSSIWIEFELNQIENNKRRSISADRRLLAGRGAVEDEARGERVLIWGLGRREATQRGLTVAVNMVAEEEVDSSTDQRSPELDAWLRRTGGLRGSFWM